jgi:hypothetical protein
MTKEEALTISKDGHRDHMPITFYQAELLLREAGDRKSASRCKRKIAKAQLEHFPAMHWAKY